MKTVVSVFGVTPFRIGGPESFARELSKQLGERGWKSVLCFSSKPPEDVLNYLKLPNVCLEVVRDLETPDPIRWAAVKDLVGILRKYHPDILHLHFTGFIGPFPWLARIFAVSQVFFTDQSSRSAFHAPRRAPFWKRGLARLVNWPITRVICASNYGYKCFTTLDLLSVERFSMIYNGVDLSRVPLHSQPAWNFRRKYSISEKRAIVLQVSWMIPQKGIEDLLDAASMVLSRHQEAHFVLVGEGLYREQYTKYAAEKGLKDHVTFTGLIEDPFAEGVYAAADVVCQVSRWEELFGFVIAEAMASSKPVVATRVGGIPELIEDGETGFLVPRGDASQIADKISMLLANRSLRERMGSAARRVAEAKFDVRSNVAHLVRLYGI
jgi:glycosyltransferase involved in cell wall biosynthesis